MVIISGFRGKKETICRKGSLSLHMDFIEEQSKHYVQRQPNTGWKHTHTKKSFFMR